MAAEDDVDRAFAYLPDDDGRQILRTFWQATQNAPHCHQWLVGRMRLWAAQGYLQAATAAMQERRPDDAQRYCRQAARCLTAAAPALPAWERANARQWATQVQRIVPRLDDAPFATAHLTALQTKIVAQVRFVPQRAR